MSGKSINTAGIDLRVPRKMRPDSLGLGFIEITGPELANALRKNMGYRMTSSDGVDMVLRDKVHEVSLPVRDRRVLSLKELNIFSEKTELDMSSIILLARMR